MAHSQMAQSEIGGMTAGNHVIELIHGRKSVLMNKPATIHDAKKEAILCFGAALGRVDVDHIQLSFRPSYLSAVVWDDAAWAILPQAARVRVTVKEQDVPLVRRVASAGVPVARPPPLRTAAAAPDPVVRQPQLQSRATSSATAARQERRARRGPYRTGTAPTQAETRQLNRIIRSFERSFNAARASDTANARTGAQAASITAGTSAAAAESSRPNSLPVTQPSPASTEDPADYRSSAPSPPSVRNDVDSRNHGSSTSVARLSNIVPAGHPSGTQRQGVNGRPSSVAGATRVPAGGAAPASAARRETQLASSASTVHPSTSSTPGNTGSLSSSFSVPQAVASSSSSAQPRAALQRQVATQDPVPSLVVTPPADAIALYLPAALQPVTTIKLRSGATYLQPRAQEVWTFDNLEPDFRFRYVRERIARMRGTIPGRTTLTYKGVTLQDHWKASEVSMKDGDTIFYFFDQPRVHSRAGSPQHSSALA